MNGSGIGNGVHEVEDKKKTRLDRNRVEAYLFALLLFKQMYIVYSCINPAKLRTRIYVQIPIVVLASCAIILYISVDTEVRT